MKPKKPRKKVAKVRAFEGILGGLAVRVFAGRFRALRTVGGEWVPERRISLRDAVEYYTELPYARAKKVHKEAKAALKRGKK